MKRTGLRQGYEGQRKVADWAGHVGQREGHCVHVHLCDYTYNTILHVHVQMRVHHSVLLSGGRTQCCRGFAMHVYVYVYVSSGVAPPHRR